VPSASIPTAVNCAVPGMAAGVPVTVTADTNGALLPPPEGDAGGAFELEPHDAASRTATNKPPAREAPFRIAFSS
jgi:hypothetical protein